MSFSRNQSINCHRLGCLRRSAYFSSHGLRNPIKLVHIKSTLLVIGFMNIKKSGGQERHLEGYQVYVHKFCDRFFEISFKVNPVLLRTLWQQTYVSKSNLYQFMKKILVLNRKFILTAQIYITKKQYSAFLRTGWLFLEMPLLTNFSSYHLKADDILEIENVSFISDQFTYHVYIGCYPKKLLHSSI